MSLTRAKRKPAAPPSTSTARSNKSAYANREQSWLSFNQRVLEQARSTANPLLERVKFLAIVSSNLDEFFEIRVAGLMQQADSETTVTSLDGLTPREQLKRVYQSVDAMVAEQYVCWHEDIVPALAKEGIRFHTAGKLDETEKRFVRHYFDTQVLPVLTPLAVDQAHPFPQLGN